MFEVAKIMVGQNLSFRQAYEIVQEKPISLDEATALQRRKGWEELIWHEKNLYYEKLGSDPDRTRNVLKGQIIYSIDKLIQDGQYDKAVQSGLTLAKIEYGALAETQVNVLGGLNTEEIEKVKKRLAELRQAAEPGNKIVN